MLQHHSSTLYSEGHTLLFRNPVYLLFSLVALVAIIEFSAALLITLALTFGLMLAFMERVEKLNARPHIRSQTIPVRLLGDGGSFPSGEPERERPRRRPATVLDGGSLEHHRY
ncbi:MAG: hypothetical protein P8103_18275 [Candidatus Thiodiazotropha sp.]